MIFFCSSVNGVSTPIDTCCAQCAAVQFADRLSDAIAEEGIIVAVVRVRVQTMPSKEFARSVDWFECYIDEECDEGEGEAVQFWNSEPCPPDIFYGGTYV